MSAIGIALALALAACAEPEQTVRLIDDPTDMVEVPPEVLANSGRGRTPYALGTPTILYLHFDGLTITKTSGSDAAANKSFIGGGAVPAFVGDQATRDQVVALVKQVYADFNIQVVTTRPTSGNYDMAVIGGKPSHLGLSYPAGVVGVAPMDCGNQMPRDIAFIFSDSLKAIVSASSYAQRVAETAAHEAAHTYGLPHSDDGCDLMSYKTCTKLKTFLDQSMAMQSDSYGQCGMTSMNSRQLLLAELGAASTQPTPTPTPTPPADTQAPTVSITSPAAGAKVAGSVTVKATVSDDKGATRVELLVDGTLATSRTAAPWELTASLADGPHTLTVQAFDAAGNRGQASVTVTAATATPPAAPPASTSPTTPPVTPPAGTPPAETPPEPAPAGSFGAACAGATDCDSKLCAEDPAGDKYCTQACEVSAGCPGGAECLPSTASTFVCSAPAPSVALSGDQQLFGSCSVSGRADPSWILPLLLCGLALLRRRR